jgi:toxin FitB
MNLVDSCGWIEFFSNGPNAGVFAPAIENLDRLLVPTICVFEVFKKVQTNGLEFDAFEVIAMMRSGRVVDLDLPLSVFAAQYSAELGLPMADSIILATARTYDAVIWTQDADFKGIEGVKYVERKSGLH